MIETAGVSVSELLVRSRAAHTAYQLAMPRMQRVGSSILPSGGDPAKAVQKLDEAGAYRKAAEESDPTFTDPAWDVDAAAMGCQHHELLTFYGEQLTRPELAERLQRIAVAANSEAAVKGKNG